MTATVPPRATAEQAPVPQRDAAERAAAPAMARLSGAAPAVPAAPAASVTPAPSATSATPGADPLAPALAALPATTDDGARALLADLQLLQQRLRGPWQRIDPPSPPDDGRPLLDARGAVLGRLWQRPDHVLWQDAQGRFWRAALGPADAAAR